MTATQSILTALTQRPDPTAEIDWPELVLLLWRADKRRFGMPNIDGPDTKIIQAVVSKMVPKTKAWQRNSRPLGVPTLERVATGVYRLTEEGMRRGRRADLDAAAKELEGSK